MIHHSAKVDETVRVYGDRSLLHVGAGSRIDAYTVITVGLRGVRIGQNTHVGTGCRLMGAGGGIVVGPCCSLSPGVSVFTASDRPAEDDLVGPCVPDKFRNVVYGDVVISAGAALFTNVIVLPGVTVGFGSVVEAEAIIVRDVPEGLYLRRNGTATKRDVAKIRDRISEVIREDS